MCYLFCFRQLKSVYPYIKEKEKESKGNKERINKLTRIIFDLLDYESPPEEYALTLNNRLNIDLKAEENNVGNSLKETKKAFKLEVSILRNNKMDLNFEVLASTLRKQYTFEVNS